MTVFTKFVFAEAAELLSGKLAAQNNGYLFPSNTVKFFTCILSFY